jgi:hypothetical protein
MDTAYTASHAPVADQATAISPSAISWAAISAGTAVAISITLVLLILGSGLGLASFTPSARNVASSGSLAALAIVWIVVVQWLSAAFGGYVTGRLRTRWVGTHAHEVFFRDTAHGLVTWAVATAIVALVVGSATSSVLSGGIHAATTTASGAAQGAAANVQGGSVAPYDVDALFRTTSGDVNSSASAEGRGEATSILARGLTTGGVPDVDRTYLATLVATRTGISPADAQKRVDEVVARARQESEAARKAAATTSLLTALAMMIGAFVACAAAALGGHERDRHP